MKFLADMGISPRVVEKLQAEGYQAVHLYELDLMKMSDADILKKARKEKSIVLTHDLDFGELLAASGGELPSVVIFRLKDMRADNVNLHLLGLLKQHAAALEKGVICSVSDGKVRIRSLPIE